MSSDLPAPPLPAELFRARRERVLEQIPCGVVLLGAGPEMVRGRDGEIAYRPDSDFYYLTGLVEPGTVVLLTPHDPDHRFTLFVRQRDVERERWNGARVGVEGARDLHSADAAYPIDELDTRLPALLEPAEEIVCALGRDPEMDARILRLFAGLRRTRPRTGRGPLVLRDAELVLAGMRMMKSPEEVERIRRAAQITVEGHLAAMRAAAPGVGEWALEAAAEHAFRTSGATGPAFPTIAGSGANATVLHYSANSRRMRDGELVLLDAGAEWGMYAGDVSRTFPVSGRFSGTQRALYEVVLAAEEAAIATVRPGATAAAPHDAAVRALTEGMVRLGLLAGEVDDLIASEAYRRFYMHRTSHWLGLDVHDAGWYVREGEPVPLVPGMVLTIEPGIYVAADAEGVPDELRGVGIRIEDDVLVTESGSEILTREVPVDPDEVERLVGK